MAGRSSSASAPKTPTFRLTQKQRELRNLLSGPQLHTLIYGGGRSGKTFLIVRSILIRAVRAAGSRHAIVRLRGNAVRSSIWLDTLPKVTRLCFPDLEIRDHRQDGFVEIDNGSQIWFGGLDEKDRVEKILGQEFAGIYFNECSQIPYSSVLVAQTRLAQNIGLPLRAYYDLNPAGTRHWTYQLWIDGIDPISRTRLSEADRALYRYGTINPEDNADNLPEQTLRVYRSLPERQRKRFFLGQYVSDIDGALWTVETLEHARCDSADVPTTLRRVIIAVDPSGTEGNEETRSDAVGIVAAGLAMDGTAYLLEDATCNLPPEGWGRRVAFMFDKWKADRVVAETNFGGAMVRFVIKAANAAIPVKVVTASRGKAARAEPVSALYGHEQDGAWIGDKVRHAGQFPELEDELLNFSVFGYQGARSPNRADALIWALTDLALGPQQDHGRAIPIVMTAPRR
ncbi:MAG TPA: phage terminase large subunit [Stellaceae bacterium]|nr:phage terminase large subunit [Stellaceae bacterium]